MKRSFLFHTDYCVLYLLKKKVAIVVSQPTHFNLTYISHHAPCQPDGRSGVPQGPDSGPASPVATAMAGRAQPPPLICFQFPADIHVSLLALVFHGWFSERFAFT